MLVDVPTLLGIRRSLWKHRPVLLPTEGKTQAAVAVLLRESGEVPELLFIERAEHPRDPWSGHMAFPGGRIDPVDATPQRAAERETLEEVGISLASAELLGRLDDLEGRHAGRPSKLVISAFVYHLARTPGLRLSDEVREAMWVRLADTLEPARHVDYRPRASIPIGPYPGIVVGNPDRHVVWGLTYRFLEVLLEVIGHPLSNRWQP